MQIIFYLPEFGRKIIELDIDKVLPSPEKKKNTKNKKNNKKSKFTNQQKKIRRSRKLLSALQELFIEMTKSNRKYANPMNVINSVTNEKGK